MLAQQFETNANAEIHGHTTARKIIADFENERLDYFVTGYGMGGTVSGVAHGLHAARPKTKIILTETANAALLASDIAQSGTQMAHQKAAIPPGSPIPFKADPDFIPLLLQEAIDKNHMINCCP